MPVLQDSSYSAPYIVRNPHLASLLPFAFRWNRRVKFQRERIDTPDGDFLDLDYLLEPSNDILLLITHGLEGSSKSPHCMGMASFFNQRGWDTLTWNLRSCSGEMNRTEKFYHGGMIEDLELAFQHAMAKKKYKSVVLMGFSLGGNITLKYLGEKGESLDSRIKKAVVFSTPVELGKSSDHISNTYNSSYSRWFLAAFKKKLIAKSKMMPGRWDLEPLKKIKTIRQFDHQYNAPLYNFTDADHFYKETSALYVLHRIGVPTLIINAQNDPFLPEECYPKKEALENDHLFLEMPDLGGHIGFFTFEKGGWFWSENRAWKFLEDIHENKFQSNKADKKGWVEWGKERIWLKKEPSGSEQRLDPLINTKSMPDLPTHHLATINKIP